jgi:Cu/Ag efflux protein CusF
MRKFITSTAAMIVAAACATSAPATTISGTIASVDKKNDSITLVDGRKFTLPEGVEAETLKSGEKVTVTYTMKNGRMVVSNIHPTR